MKAQNHLVGFLLLMSGLLYGPSAIAQDRGATLFQQTCAACHTIGEGQLIGPDLANVHERRDEEWIIRFVQSSQRMIDAGDPEAIAVFEEFNQIPMPDHALSDDQVRAILQYIVRESGAGQGTVATSEPAPADAAPIEQTAQAVQLGRDLFVGTIRLQNGGPSCNACHRLDTDAAITGGALAKDLTTAYSRLTGAGVQNITTNPPFPVMKQAFQGKPVTQEEATHVAAFLQSVDEASSTQAGRNYGNLLLGAGLAGVILLLGAFALLWMHRSTSAVNDEIYARQVTSM